MAKDLANSFMNKMTQDLVNSFWKKWLEADELKQLDLVQTLTGMKDYGTASLVNSYLTDLKDYLEEVSHAKE